MLAKRAKEDEEKRRRREQEDREEQRFREDVERERAMNAEEQRQKSQQREVTQGGKEAAVSKMQHTPVGQKAKIAEIRARQQAERQQESPGVHPSPQRREEPIRV